LNKPIPFGKYFLLERINVGGMAEVFKAKTVGVEGFERIVALKRILPSIAEDEEFITMFIDEAKIAVQLQHANIAQIFDLGKVEDSYFIALEFVNGRDLRSIFEDLRKVKQSMPIPQVCYLVMQLCEGLDYAHNKRDTQGRELLLVHRDISPQNVLLGYDGEVKLIDFGIAKAAGKASKTQAGILKGKFGYMSPEQVRGLPIDRRSDIFALGIVLYEMLTGERLFIGESDFSTLEKVRNVEIVPPSSFNSQIPAKLETIVLKALEKDVEDRYQNAIDLHDDLQLFLHSTGLFSSRKDLSAWMRRTFSANAQATNDQFLDEESLEPISEPSTSPDGKRGRARANADSTPSNEDFGWDEDEVETQIFEKDPLTGRTLNSLAVHDAMASEENTVAGKPANTLLSELGGLFDDEPPTRSIPVATDAAALAATVRGEEPLRKTRHGMGQEGPSPSSPQPSPFAEPFFPSPASPALDSSGLPDPNRPVFRQTLMGGAQVPVMPTPGVVSANPTLPAGSLFPTGPAYPTLQPPSYALPAPRGTTHPGQITAPISPFQTAATTGDYQRHLTMPVRVHSRLRYYIAFILCSVLGGTGTFLYLTRPGKLQVSVRPQDAKLSIDGVRITSGPPYLLQKRPGTYRLSLAQDGYVTKEQVVRIDPGQGGHTDIDLEPSPESGFDLTSQPTGGLVWLDGQPLAMDENGKQAVTDFHASRIPPGRHVIEIRGNPAYKPWRQEFYQEPNRTVRLHADLEPIAPQKSHSRSSSAAAATAATPAIPPTAPVAAPKPRVIPPPAPLEKLEPFDKPERATTPARAEKKVAKDQTDIFDVMKTTPTGKKEKASTSSEDIFETEDKLGRSGIETTCTMTINSKPVAEVSVDGKPTGMVTPLLNFPISCGTHRITFKNADLMIERNESVTIKPGRVFKKTFSLVEAEL
jgi:serine/threonine protein kinase